MQGYRRKFYSADIFDEITYLVTNTLFLVVVASTEHRDVQYHKDDHQYEDQYEEILSTDVVDAGVMYNVCTQLYMIRFNITLLTEMMKKIALS